MHEEEIFGKILQEERKTKKISQEKLAKLTQAQEDLRAVLTTRQECIAVMGGLLN